MKIRVDAFQRGSLGAETLDVLFLSLVVIDRNSETEDAVIIGMNFSFPLQANRTEPCGQK